MAEPQLIYADGDIVVAAKPPGMVVHPGSGHQEGHLLGWLKDTLAGDGDVTTLAPGHRIDKATSGLVLFGRHREALARIEALFKGRNIDKVYLALAQGVTHRKGKITQPLSRRDGEGFLKAETRFRRLRYSRAATLVRATPITGRPHQIRRHLKSVGHPIAGDTRWGKHSFNEFMSRVHGLDRLYLHAAGLGFLHPMTGEEMHFVEPLPEDLLQVLRSLEVPAPPFPWGPAQKEEVDGEGSGEG